ncbi:dynein regulatory complex subunit 3 [Echinops telfairi]|uniref:Dynein regulatory complex subunit 3 n=1 Tax=Echinops telfairi TaxID=9371 RepID=A0AC55DBW9_ECHTE|nr:dynein regulatory complex subunit 3 [Echinops telfairi]
MNQICGSIEPRVMDDDMLKMAVAEQGPREEAGQLAKQEGILFKDVLSLQLDFQNILQIDNLWQFENLRKLQLDNNVIERIQGLEKLTHLVWLDLSFNNIEAIEGLDTLVNLEDLSLFNNRISKIDSLDALVKLQVLCLGNNEVSNMMNVIYLRRFKNLRTLSLSGNPISEAEDYKMFICAYLPDLVYLDFRRIDDHTAGFIEHLNGSFLFDSMYSEDVEGNKLSYLPGVSELLGAYPFKLLLPLLAEPRVPVPPPCLRQVLASRNPSLLLSLICSKFLELSVCSKFLEHPDRYTIEVYSESPHNLNAIREESEMPAIEMKIVECGENITQLFNELMSLEMQLVEQLEETINMFERNIIDLVGLFIENVQGLMAQCRDLENHHHEKLLEIAINTLEKIVKGEFDEDLPDDVRALFVDKDTIVNAVGASHDIHLLKIDNREDELVTRVNSWCTQLVDKIHVNEITRNRRRVKEINQYIDHMQNELDNLELSDTLD